MLEVIKIKTYQDYIAVAENEKEKRDFMVAAINEHCGSPAYRKAVIANEYYAKKNTTISKYQKFLYTMSGKAVADNFSANYKTKTTFFRLMIIQQVQYILTNGITFANKKTKERLGRDFDYQIQLAVKRAMIDGVSFVFANYDHIEVFGFADTPSGAGFVPLYDEETSLLRAGIRYWYSGETGREILHMTLYSEDGYESYIKSKDEIILTEPKRGYISVVKSTGDGLITEVEYSNYSSFPIVPMYANDLHESELEGLRESIDCYDYIKNGLANDIDDTAGIYWTIKNSGGFDDVDMARFLDRMRIVKAASVEDDGADIEAHTLDVPVEARKTMLDVLLKDLYRDSMILNVEELSSGNKTATEIRAAYQPQDNRSADMEYLITDTIQKILAVFGIDDEPSYKWNRIANLSEETQMVLTAANYLDDESILNHLPWLTPEEVADILKRRDADEMNRMGVINANTGLGGEDE